MRGRYLTADQRAYILAHYADGDTAAIAERLEVHAKTVYYVAASAGIKKSDAWRARDAIRKAQIAHTDPRIAATRFPPGHRSWNKGTHFVAGGRSAETRFRPGNLSLRWDPEAYAVGALRITTDGELQIKLAHGGYGTWQQLSRYAWKLKTGRWPPSTHAVLHINGDRDDCQEENLKLISRGRLLKMNVHDRIPKDVLRLVQLKGAITRQVNRITRQSEEA